MIGGGGAREGNAARSRGDWSVRSVSTGGLGARPPHKVVLAKRVADGASARRRPAGGSMWPGRRAVADGGAPHHTPFLPYQWLTACGAAIGSAGGGRPLWRASGGGPTWLNAARGPPPRSRGVEAPPQAHLVMGASLRHVEGAG